MKKKFLLCLLIVFMLGTFVGNTETYSKNITAWFYDIKVNIDNAPVAFINKPFIYNGHTYVPISEVAKYLNLNIQWNDNTKTVHLTSSSNNSLAMNSLQHELDKKILEVNNLKLQIQQKDAQLDILKNNANSNYYDNDSSYVKNRLDDLRATLKNDYYRHRNNGRSMYFTYSISRYSDGDINVKMYADFDRTSTYWSDRDKAEFRDFILDISKEIERKFSNDIIVNVFDEDDDTLGIYYYTYKQSRLTYSYEY